MELYLDSADIKEIDEAFKLGFLTGLTTTPTFMHRGGVTNIDKMILDLAKKVPILQVEALGETAEEVVKEAKRQLKMGLKKETTVFKIPVSLEGLRACRMLRNEGIMVNVHLVYTLQQAYMAMQAGANYVCPLVGRLQDQGHDALSLVEQCVEAVNYYGYDSKIMFSSVRTVEHVRNAVTIGVHTITVPWKLMKQLTDNHFTTIGTQQFYVDTRLITMKVKDILSHTNPVVKDSSTVSEALVEMTKHGFGAVMVIDAKGKNTGVFTDGGLRRGLEKEGNKFLTKKLSALKFNAPFTISPEALLDEAQKAFKEHKVDTLSVSENGKQLGMLDIQDLMKAIAGWMIQGEHPIDRDPFQELGTELLFSHEELKERLSGIRAVLFDWDGVFNDGWKDIDGGSPFSEVGSMGVNMLRFGLWLQNDERLPSAAVITGQHNGHAERFAQREKLHGLYMGFINKVDAFDTFLRKHGLNENEVAFFYDDAIDLAVAARCGLRILLRGQASEFFVKHAVERGSVDIITALSGGQNGLREATDALLTLMGRYSAVIDHRAAYSDGYQRYLKARNATVPEVVSGIR